MEIRPLSSHTGAEVLGIDLTRPVSDSDRAAMNRAFVERSVLVVRDQALTPPQVVEAVGLFGMIFPQQNTKFAIPDCPQIHYVSNQDRFPDGRRYIPGDGWHTDHSNAARPPKATVLHAVRLPDAGRRHAVCQHGRGLCRPATRHQGAPRAADGHPRLSEQPQRAKLMGLNETDKERVPNAVLHPLVRTHPESGAKSIYLNPIRIEGILGLDHKEALPLLVELLEHGTQERFQYRHAWKPGDFVMWDNRCLLHKANGDYDMDQVRYLYRVMLQGDVPR